MSFLLECPNCGRRDVAEFRFGGEASQRPADAADRAAWTRYVYSRCNVAGEQVEWWRHRQGCGKWFLAARDTRNNEVNRTWWPGQAPAGRDPDFQRQHAP